MSIDYIKNSILPEYNKAIEALKKAADIGRSEELGIYVIASPENHQATSFLDEDLLKCSEFMRGLEGDDYFKDAPILFKIDGFDFRYRILSKMKYPYNKCPRCWKYKPECGTAIPKQGSIERYDRHLCYRCDDYMLEENK